MKAIWKHKKGGFYRVLGFAVIEKGLVPAVMYQAVDHEGPVFVRPCEEFFDGRFRQEFDYGDE